MKKPKRKTKKTRKPTLKEKWGDPRIVTASNDPYGRP